MTASRSSSPSRCSRASASAPASTVAPASNTVKAAPSRLSLFGLLNYLWEEAGLCEWGPQFKGRRFWGVVSNRLQRRPARQEFKDLRL